VYHIQNVNAYHSRLKGCHQVSGQLHDVVCVY
jgi:hypothetical protein